TSASSSRCRSSAASGVRRSSVKIFLLLGRDAGRCQTRNRTELAFREPVTPAPRAFEPTLRARQCVATHGAPEHTSTTAPPVCKKSDFWVRASGELRGVECGSNPVDDGAVLVVGGVSAPLSQTTSAP